jgi:hypothetical protein
LALWAQEKQKVEAAVSLKVTMTGNKASPTTIAGSWDLVKSLIAQVVRRLIVTRRMILMKVITSILMFTLYLNQKGMLRIFPSWLEQIFSSKI